MTPPTYVTLPEIREAARQKLSRDVWNFGDGGAETETTLRRNREHLDRLAIRQYVLVDVRKVDLSTTFSASRCPGRWRSRPWAASSSSIRGRLRDGAAAAQGDTLQFLSGATGWSVEDVAKAAAGRSVPALSPRRPRLGGRAHEARGGLGIQLGDLTVDVQWYGRASATSSIASSLARPCPRPEPRGPTRLSGAPHLGRRGVAAQDVRLPIG
jgi:hypothetical protein